MNKEAHMKINSVRGVLLLAGIALVVVKTAGLIDWPWLAVLIPLLAWGYPYIAGLAGVLGHLALGVLMLGFIVILGLHADHEHRVLMRRRKRDIAEGRIEAGLWDGV